MPDSSRTPRVPKRAVTTGKQPTAPASTREESSDRAAPNSREAALLDLQRVVGNRAIEALVGRGDVPPPDGAHGPLPRAWGDTGPGRPPTSADASVQRRDGESTEIQRRGRSNDPVDQARELLSYGLTNWVITDNDALRALALFSNIPQTQLGAAVNRLGSKYLLRLLDNLPASGRRSPTYTRIIVAMGPVGIVRYLDQLLSTGVFDWMVTPEEARNAAYIIGAFVGRNVARAVELLSALDHAQQDLILPRLRTAGHLATIARVGSANIHLTFIQPLIARFGRGAAMTTEQRAITKAIFDASPNTQLETLKTCMSQRFDFAIGGAQTAGAAGETAIDWEPLGLRRMYPVLEALPQSHVATNARMLSMGRYQGTGVSGYYWRNEAAIGYDVAGLDDTQSSDAGDPLVGVNRFDKVVRHEVGHAVDAQMGWSDGAGAQASNRGGWRKYGGATQTVVDAMVADSGGAIAGLGDPQKRRIVRVIKRAMDNRNSNLAQLKTAVEGIAGWDRLDEDVRESVLDDPVLEAVSVALRNPWYRHPQGGIELDGKIYQESYASNWTRYEHAARARKVSQYQFRAPGEWFAEAYAAYYEPNAVRGAVLARRDPNSKAWFDREVHTLAASR